MKKPNKKATIIALKLHPLAIALLAIMVLSGIMAQDAFGVPLNGRWTGDLVTLYTFQEGSGNTVHDVSGEGDDEDLTPFAKPKEKARHGCGGLTYGENKQISKLIWCSWAPG